MTPSFAPSLPKIVSSNSSPAIQTAAGAHHYRLVALELTVASGLSINYNVVLLGDGSATSTSQVPTNIILDRVYIHGQANDNLRRGVGLNSATSAVIDSYISNVHEAGNDNQAIMCWNGPGPVKISNNYLEAAGENVLFGGADRRSSVWFPQTSRSAGTISSNQLHGGPRHGRSKIFSN